MEQNPEPVAGRAGARRVRGRRRARVRAEPVGVPAVEAHAGLAIEQAHVDGWLGTTSSARVRFRRDHGRGSRLLRRRRGDGPAGVPAGPARHGSARPPFPAERGVYNRPTVVNNVETLCNMGFIAKHGPTRTRPSARTRDQRLEADVLQRAVRQPDGLRGPIRDVDARTVRARRRRPQGRPSIKAVQLGGPLGGILPASQLDTPFDFDALAAEGCMVGHGSILAFDDHADMREVARHLLRFGAHESCGKCFPCRIGLKRAYDSSPPTAGR